MWRQWPVLVTTIKNSSKMQTYPAHLCATQAPPTPPGIRRGRANRGRLAALLLAAVYVVASLAVQRLGGAASTAAATAITAGSRVLLEAPSCRPPLVVLLTTHKTGTAQAGCIKGEVVRALDLWRSARYDNQAAGAHAVSDFAAGPFATAAGALAGVARHLRCSIASPILEPAA